MIVLDIPFDPRWTFEELVNTLFDRRQRTLTAGQARSRLIEAWGRCVGRTRAQRELIEFASKHKNTSAAAKAAHMTVEMFKDLRALMARMPEPAESSLVEALIGGEFSVLQSLDASALSKVTTSVLSILSDSQMAAKIVEGEEPLSNLFRSAFRVAELKRAVDQLERYLAEGVSDENTYQSWCDRHSWAFGNSYVIRDEVRRISAGDQLDLLLPTLIGYRDIIELKRPDMEVIGHDKSHDSYYFSAKTSGAIGQCHRYLDVLQDEAAKGLRDYPHVVAYHPHATIVIGRSSDWSREKLKALHGLNRRMHGISVMTYDHLLSQSRQMLAVVSQAPSSSPAG
jgi:hypothetical protein